MEFMDASQEFSASNDLSVVIKRKRTKRGQRPLSPVGGAAAVTHTSSSSSGGGGGDREVLGYTSEISASTSTDQEDEDMANCLILLAQGESCRKKVDEDEIKMEKLGSRKFNEMVTSTIGGKVGFFVYECKTCNRTFPSFQALGGHRTSHKKPKVTTEEKKAAVVNDDIRDKEQEEEENEEHGQFNRLSLPDVKGCLGTRSDNNKSLPNTNKAKIHECGICGAEFFSGQALGGHMRRHRNSLTSTKVPMILETTSTHDHEESSFQDDFQKPRNIFPLDLNLPAPTEDDIHRDLKFQFSPNQQQQHHLVFSAPALVDCHY